MKPGYALAGVLACVGFFHVATIREGHTWGDDFSAYIHHAKNLVEGRPYAQIGYIPNPANLIAPRSYPPVFPCLLAPVYAWFGLNLTAMKIELILCFLLSLLMIFFVLRELTDPSSAVAVTALVGFNPYFWEFKDEILSDIPFLFLTYTTIFLILRADRPSTPSRRRLLDGLLAGVTALLACETRTVGVVLVAAVVVTDLIRFRRPTMRTWLVVLPVIVFKALTLSAAHGESGYFTQLRTSFNPHLAWINADFYSREIRDLWRNGYTRGPMRAIFLAMNGLAGLGYGRRLLRPSQHHPRWEGSVAARWGRDRKTSLCEIFLLLYGVMTFLWPLYQGIRLFIPLIPLYIFYAAVGLEWVADRCRRPSARPAQAVMLALISTSYLARYTTLDYGPIREGVGRPETVELLDYLKRESPPEAVVIFAKPRLLALWTDRKASVYHEAPDEELLGYFDRIGAEYAITAKGFTEDQARFRPFLERQAGRFEIAFANAEFTAYRRRQEPAR